MGGSLYLAWRYVRHQRATTAVLVASITLIAYLPAALEVIVRNAEQHFRARAVSTPLVVGARGSPLELVLASVYFDEPYEDVLRMGRTPADRETRVGAGDSATHAVQSARLRDCWNDDGLRATAKPAGRPRENVEHVG